MVYFIRLASRVRGPRLQDPTTDNKEKASRHFYSQQSTLSPNVRSALKESAKERGRFIRDADNLVRSLPIESEIEFGLRPSVIPVAKRLQLAPSQAPFRQCGLFDGDAHARRLPEDAAFFWDRFGRSDRAARDKTLPALVLARKDENRVAFGNVLATVHRLLRFKLERFRSRIANLSFDRERHLAPLIHDCL